jgi:hypothetical protein
LEAAGRERPTAVGRLLVRHAEFLDQALHASRFFEWIQILALDVLDQTHRQRGFVGDLADQHRHDIEPGKLRGAPAALAGDDLVALAARPGAPESAA